jgi:hypothetical protein
MDRAVRSGFFGRTKLERAVFCILTIGFGLGCRPSFALGSDVVLIAKQLPKRYAVMRTILGDLNSDVRPLLIFLRDSTGHLRRVARADHVIACRNCGGLAGDPWRHDHGHPAFVTIKHSVFILTEFAGSGWRGWTRKSFKYEPRERRWSLLGCRSKVFRVDHDFPVETQLSTADDFGQVWLEEFGNPTGCWTKNQR